MREKRNSNDETQYLTFHVASEEYAIGILRIKEIIPYGALTKVPQTPPAIRGVINLRGSVVPVVDLAVKFGLAASSVTARTCIVIVEMNSDGEQTTMGVMADSVSQVIEFSANDILPAPPFGTGVSVNFLIGMGKAGNKFVLILDIDKVLSAGELDNLTPQSALAMSSGGISTD
ncbi:MAG TPA: chemotaxis protein CheW [Candidatus Binatia bacterium]|jgi:purine-binding chemotaxis protein CheW